MEYSPQNRPSIVHLKTTELIPKFYFIIKILQGEANSSSFGNLAAILKLAFMDYLWVTVNFNPALQR